jgi:hypothetical protein
MRCWHVLTWGPPLALQLNALLLQQPHTPPLHNQTMPIGVATPQHDTPLAYTLVAHIWCTGTRNNTTSLGRAHGACNCESTAVLPAQAHVRYAAWHHHQHAESTAQHTMHTSTPCTRSDTTCGSDTTLGTNHTYHLVVNTINQPLLPQPLRKPNVLPSIPQPNPSNAQTDTVCPSVPHPCRMHRGTPARMQKGKNCPHMRRCMPVTPCQLM